MLYKTKMFVRVIVLLYPKPSQLHLFGIIAGYKVKMSKRTSRNKELGIIMRIWSLVWISSWPQYKFQLDEKPLRDFLVTPFEKVSRRARVAQSSPISIVTGKFFLYVLLLRAKLKKQDC